MDCTDTFCLLCLKTISDKDFKLIEENIRKTLNDLLPQLNSTSRNKKAMCNDCSRRFSAMFEFRSKCLDAANTITPSIDCEKALQLDLTGVLAKEKENISVDHETCRLCAPPAKSEHISLRKVNIGMFQELLPEINFGAVRDPVVCKSCFDSADTHTNFLRDCLNVEKKMKETSENPKRSGQPDDPSPDLPVKSEYVRIKTENNEYEVLNRPEYVEIKSEENRRESDVYPFYSNKQTIDNISQRDTENRANPIVKYEAVQDGAEPEEDPLDAKPHSEGQPEAQLYDIPKRKVPSETQRSHTKTNKPPYKCPACPYETNWKCNLTRHSLKHQDPALVQLHACPECDFKTKYRESLAEHQLRHRDVSEVTLYGCDECDYRTKHKSNLTTHRLTHQNASELQMYGCDQCPYRAKRKRNLLTHRLTHKQLSEVQTFRCGACPYETKYKWSLTQHRVVHESGARTYGCPSCEYRTRHKSNVRKHQLRHRSRSEVRMYGCDVCGFESKRKKSLVTHRARHGVSGEGKVCKNIMGKM